jgi:hypothetical protein
MKLLFSGREKDRKTLSHDEGEKLKIIFPKLNLTMESGQKSKIIIGDRSFRSRAAAASCCCTIALG